MERSREETYRLIGKAGLIILLLTLGDKVLAVVKEMVMAGRFGIAPSLDAFNIAYAYPAIFVLLASGALVSAFVPLYIEWCQVHSGPEADARARALLLLTTGSFGLIAVGSSFLSPYIFPLFGHGFEAGDKKLGIALQRLLVFLIFLDGTAILLNGLLLAKKRFAALHTAPMFINASIIAFLVFQPQLGIYTLVWGFLAGTLCKLLYLGVTLRISGFRFWARPRFDGVAVRVFFSLAFPLLGSELISNMNILVDQVMATNLSSGSVSTLRYAYRLNDLPIQLVVLGLSKAIFPFISESALQNDLEGLRDVYARCLVFLAFLTLPVVCLVTLFSREIVSLVLQRGAFDENAARLTADTLRCYNYGLFFYGYTFVNGAFFSALRKGSSLFYMGCLSIVLNFCLNLLLMRVMGVQGIALSTTLTLILVSAGFLILLKKRLRIPSMPALFKGPGVILAAALFMYTVGFSCKEAAGAVAADAAPWLFPLFSGMVALMAYFSFLWLVGKDEWRFTVGLIAASWRRR